VTGLTGASGVMVVPLTTMFLHFEMNFYRQQLELKIFLMVKN
jgi:hypothetical protein